MVFNQGERLRKQFDRYLNQNSIRNSITINSRTRTADSYGGYTGDSYSSSSNSTYCIPVTEYVQTRMGLVKYADLREGDLRILVRGDESIDENDTATYNSLTYLVREIKPVIIGDITVCKDVLLAREV